MQLKRIAIVAVIVVAGLIAASPWVQADRIDMLDLFTQQTRTDSGTGSESRSDSTTPGRRTGWFDLYTEGMGSAVVGPMWLQRNM